MPWIGDLPYSASIAARWIRGSITSERREEPPAR
jgi:hypothetical protein